MIKEYHLAAILYDEEKRKVRCAACGREVHDRKCLYRQDGRWTCGKCITGFSAAPIETALCSTLKAAVET